MKRIQIKVYGIVQGVGFRPFIYHQAIKYHLKGYVKNCSSYVLIEVEGEEINSFLESLINEKPSMSMIERIEQEELPLANDIEFVIMNSENTLNESRFISPDLAICEKCLEELKNPSSRFYNYAFTTCTSCGPRYTMIKKYPYDRQNTSMNNFLMCEECSKDYANPESRRFHSETTTCPNCQIPLTLMDSEGHLVLSDDIINTCKELLKSGHIIAIKGIGGFHLCCQATSDEAVLKLRDRKKRKSKPFAVMARDLECIKRVCEVNSQEEAVLQNNKKPIVLLKKKSEFLSKYIAKDNDKLGMMLPYAPLYHLLLSDDLEYIISTSGNITHQPLEYENDSAITHLKEVADYFLLHEREIIMPIDDSVVQVVLGKVQVIRLGRGYAPYYLKMDLMKSKIALGAIEKSSFAFFSNGYAYMSPYLGDLKDRNVLMNFQNTLKKSLEFHEVNVNEVITDSNINPHLLSMYDVPHQLVYHHHAHLLSCMAEYDLFQDVIGVILDGTGIGADKNVWGGEFLVGNRHSFKRLAHLEYVKIQGGDLAMREIDRIAISYLFHFQLPMTIIDFDSYRKDIILDALRNNINCFTTSSMGRLFDFIAFLLNVKNEVTYDGEAAIALESIVSEVINEKYDYTIKLGVTPHIIELESIMRGILDDLKQGHCQTYISTKFHNTIIDLIVKMTERLREETNINHVVLSGGVFQNKYILTRVYKDLILLNFEVYFNQMIPINDNGIALGQLIYESSDCSCV